MWVLEITKTLDRGFRRPVQGGYVDLKFQGSTAIKNVLPVLVPELGFAGMKVASGTVAWEARKRLVNMLTGKEKDDLRKSMLEYCKLDTLALVLIFEFMEDE